MVKHYEDRLIDAIVEVLTQERQRQKLSHNQLATLSGVSRPGISYVESQRHRAPSLPTCIKLAQGLGVDFSDIIRRAEKRVK